MSLIERFTQKEVLRILGVTPKQLSYWERLGFVRPRARWGEKFYRFSDLISLRAVKQLTEGGVPARRLHRAVGALQKQLAEIRTPLVELKILSDGRNVLAERDGARLEPLSGQLVFQFDAGELKEKVLALPERTPEEWFAFALDLETDPDSRPQAIEAYRRVVARKPDWYEAHVNLGALLFQQEELPEAAGCFRCAVQLQPRNPLAHYNLGTVLDELGELEVARRHLSEAVRLKRDYADAHYNLALVAEKLGLPQQARRHWQRYLQLDPTSQWAHFARQRLRGTSSAPPSNN